MIYLSILDPNFVILKAVPIFGHFNMAGMKICPTYIGDRGDETEKSNQCLTQIIVNQVYSSKIKKYYSDY